MLSMALSLRKFTSHNSIFVFRLHFVHQRNFAVFYLINGTLQQLLFCNHSLLCSVLFISKIQGWTFCNRPVRPCSRRLLAQLPHLSPVRGSPPPTLSLSLRRPTSILSPSFYFFLYIIISLSFSSIYTLQRYISLSLYFSLSMPVVHAHSRERE
jgi:hypothetical protein